MTQIRKRLSNIFNNIDNKILDGIVAVNNVGHNVSAYIKKKDPDGDQRAVIAGEAAGGVAAGSLGVAFAAATGIFVSALIAFPIIGAGVVVGAVAGNHYHKKLQQRKAKLNP